MTIECDLKHADWIEAHIVDDQRSVNDKAVLNLALRGGE